MDADNLVQDYISRLEARAAVLPAERRAELVGEVREHIDTALREAGRADEVTVRNVLERLGPPEEILADEEQHSVPGGPPAGMAAAASSSAPPPPWNATAAAAPTWGAVEVIAITLLVVAWPALLLPYGLILWVALGIGGLLLTWVSPAWSRGMKLTLTVAVVALYVLMVMLWAPVGVTMSPGTGPSPVITYQ
jgi:HAAS